MEKSLVISLRQNNLAAQRNARNFCGILFYVKRIENLLPPCKIGNQAAVISTFCKCMFLFVIVREELKMRDV